MCGIAGYISSKRIVNAQVDDVLRNSHFTRGPDSCGEHSNNQGLKFFQRRLAIVGSEIYAHQPIFSYDGKSFLIFNGEIYNWKELGLLFGENASRIIAEGSDARVLVEGIRKFGIQNFLPKLRGMFAIAYYEDDKLYLARDRFGQKPLKIAFTPEMVLFASEVGPLLESLRIMNAKLNLNQESIHHFLATGYFPQRRTFVDQIHDLIPSTILEIQWRQELKVKEHIFSSEQYFLNEPGSASLHSCLKLAIQEQLEADARIGLFMSGGTDSSLIAAIATIDFGFNGPIMSLSFPGLQDLDESTAAIAIAEELGFQIKIIEMTGTDALSMVQEMDRLSVEPLGDPSILPTMFIARVMAQECKVVLTGDGADETFFGYDRYREIQVKNQSLLNILISSKSNGLKSTLKVIRDFYLSKDQDSLKHQYFARQFPQDHWEKFIVSEDFTREEVVNLWSSGKDIRNLNDVKVQDYNSYLPQNILVKTDRATMAFSLESRIPFLDERIQEIGFSLSPGESIRNGIGKHMVKEILCKYISPKHVYRNKKGFSPPMTHWLREELRDWASHIIHSCEWETAGISGAEVRKHWNSFLNNENEDSWRLWTLIQIGRMLKQFDILEHKVN
jgi:asparagine synthase (glutamine-hydrolysing)